MYFVYVYCKGINNDWEIKTIVIAFEHVVGRHTAVNIKKTV